ncbi:FAD-dependent oxidoreductase [Streptomyces sp. WAC05374]|uniref:NAD(P)/FAD-dependent oxidoreductase n=1 Tax=Streptomyces sp. WAC05374 TaxID=2487420 RepID=UPI000F882E00|nr:NAD(P)/FAD-dependent oxidoreductase [Streptomyces sp. WAC05374]RST14638.1 FAD-dependent oxidoreductase [Streptomyces sp. WAC05374]TDF50238.1 FAD-dependent oxidoreductase [Streptomyces sp. WAC05374]TDF57962.1 FAD-dependent oxidoreductase [Streptomyces sp. WAC05374]TDF60491.1 FAD-dependent oxidoreductase [Streptomyces sp. WAC05374]
MTTHHHGRPDTVVVGAGLAGLACALDLGRAGRRVVLLEASDGVGGRMRTDRRDGFLLDRGFQVFNTSYPQVRRRLDLRRLRLRPFTPGLVLPSPTGPVRLSDPTRRPGSAASLLLGRVLPARDLAALAALTARDALPPAGLVKRRPDGSTAAALSRAGVSDATVERVLRPFLSGVFLEDRLETSARFFHLVWRSMVRGTLCLPADGIGAVPAQLAEGLPEGVLRLETPVAEITPSGVLLSDGGEVPAATVVVATDAATAARLLPGLPVPDGRTVTTYYHAAPHTPLAEPTLVVDDSGAVLNTCVLTEVTRTYAPAGTSLVSTSVLGPDRPGAGDAVLRRLSELYATDTGDWHRVAVRTVEGALPVMRPPWPLSRTTRFGPGRYVCGDHRATGSVQGALASGARAAREVLADPLLPG